MLSDCSWNYISVIGKLLTHVGQKNERTCKLEIKRYTVIGLDENKQEYNPVTCYTLKNLAEIK